MLSDIADWPADKIMRAEWRSVGHAIKQAQDRMQPGGTRETWLDWAVDLCAERGKDPATHDAATPAGEAEHG